MFAQAEQQGFDPKDVPGCCGHPMEYSLVSDMWRCGLCCFEITAEQQGKFMRFD